MKSARPYAAQCVDVRETKDYDIRIHRPYRFGNPFKIGKDGTRKEVIEKFRAWFQKQPPHMRDVGNLKGQILGCMCRPGPKKPCHGEVLLELAELPARKRQVLRPISLFPGMEEDEPEVDDGPGVQKRVETTNPASAERAYRKPWIFLRTDRSMTEDKTWVFTDGSSSGWHAAKIVRPGIDVRSLCRFREPTRIRNVGAELNGFLLGLKHVEEHSTVVAVVDFLNVAAWMTGAYEIKDPEVREKIERGHRIVKENGLRLSFIHHAGHQKDSSHFTHFNDLADKLCTAQTSRDDTVPWRSVIDDL